MTERDFAIDVVRMLQTAGFEAVWAGGCVRDQLLGIAPVDYDIATNATPEQVQALFRRTISMGASFGVIEVLGPKHHGEWLKVQVATFRRDGPYSDGRRPEHVSYSSAEEDASRRDFTINGLFFDPISTKLHDYVGGQADLQAKVLRAIGDPAARFEEDKLRVLRAVRIAARFDLSIDPQTLRAGRGMAAKVNAVSPERIAEELRKLLSHPRRVRGVQLLRDFQLVEPILPEVAPEYERALRTIEALPVDASFCLSAAAIIRTTSLTTAKAIGRRLRLSNEERQQIEWLVAMQSSLTDSPARSKLYPILAHAGSADLLALHRAIALADGGSAAFLDAIVETLRTTPREILDPPPLITGDDLVARGWKPGSQFKAVLKVVRSAQLDGNIRSEAEALELAASMKKG